MGRKLFAISAEWGAQRIKGLSIGKAFHHFLEPSAESGDIGQKITETSLIEEFLYPKYGPGQMWETVADEVSRRGGTVLLSTASDEAARRRRSDRGRRRRRYAERRSEHLPADYVFSTMPVKELIDALDTDVPDDVREVAEGWFTATSSRWDCC